ncbi:MAG: hypothetical protein H7095_06590 [Pseudopedobacter sp.]|nr:hypothetical protein [Deinococcales bacterium]
MTELSHLSASRFAHLFREQLGVSPQKYTEVDASKSIIDTARGDTYSIDNIAVGVGFENAFYFSSAYSPTLL